MVIVIVVVEFVDSQAPQPVCSLSFQTLSSNISNCDGGNWGGFLSKSCCGASFDEYLHALAQRAYQTGQLFLNANEQSLCLDVMKNFDEDVLDCGIDRLTNGGGGCSDFTVSDVIGKLGDRFKSLEDDCKLLGFEGDKNSACAPCSSRWNEIGGSFHNGEESDKIEDDVCRFAVLVSLMSSRIDDVNWILAMFKCLGEQSVNQELQESRTKKKATLIPDVKELLPGGRGCQKIPIKEIYAATNNLSALNFIGQGVAGKVYKGILSNGRHVAVKHIIKDEYVESFMREVTSLSHVRHSNLVALLGHCEEEDECFLVYELCSNGNLSEWLFGKDRVLSWIQRLEIAIDSARGLWFLHTYPGGCIVHRDIKPTNILLGDNFEAKLSDFGLSKVMDLGQSYVSSEVRGTFGYVDPEYQRNHHVNPSGDVYSLGIVLLQILSGKRVINLNVKEPMSLDKMAKILTRGGNIYEFVDPKLNEGYSMEAFNLTLKLALACTAHKQERPSMEQVVSRLEEALDISTSSESPQESFIS
ncbi:nodulation receptor kinase [Cinnamomum micranthum f. kanehirae]|uniref:Nodulation receptor kinase n=1 Tax=Cinnamomum micranthum f. kanehirae TaxID=337451 RepID=A0A443NXR3_9MAGN|nr:nodulation receptor kinase [Cinnamomum micranthum f. kanehirae]